MFYGGPIHPFGTDVLWARTELLEQMTAHQFGGGAAEESDRKIELVGEWAE